MERVEEIQRELNGHRNLAPWGQDQARIDALVDELLQLEEQVYGPAQERINLKRRLRLAGVPFDLRAPLADLRVLAKLVSSGGVTC